MTGGGPLGTGLVLCAAALAAVFAWPAEALRGWLAAMYLWSGVPVGSLGLLMIMHLTGGRWAQALPPVLEAGALTLPLTALALLPILIGMAALYPWVGGLGHGFKAAWLSPVPFVARSLILLLGLGALAWALVTRRWSAVAISSAGLIFLMPMLTFCTVDWLVSLSPEFHSSGFGLYAITNQFTVGLAAAAWILLGRQPEQVEALAALLVTMVLLWLYLAFTHYFIVWSGDLASLVGWYQSRAGWFWGSAYALVVASEAGVFFALLSRKLRHSATGLRTAAAVLVGGKAIEAGWLVLPASGTPPVPSLVICAVGVVGLGLVTIAAQQALLDLRTAARVPHAG